ncbi:hypothetical protein LJR219_001316 [Phenylobacterium sp. LjRoot219]|uniref:hypothetical protein n=1 Tax=Phenylobacterium sp. LjRoot219 TaxID=3342283 RepID=UPI003ECFC51B
MRRIALLAAACVLIAAPASAASIRISTAGKSTSEIQADVAKAAARVCWAETKLDSLAFHTRTACLRAATRDALQSAERPLTTAQR